MHTPFARLTLAALTLGFVACPLPAEVTVGVEQVTRPMDVADYRDDNQRGMYPAPDTERRVDWTGPVVTLKNEHLAVRLVPTLGMRVLNAVDAKTGRSLSGTPDPGYYDDEPFRDIIGWTAGFVEASYPYFEHGTGVRQHAGWRARDLGGDDRHAKQVAMTMRFTGHQHPRHQQRYGRYDQRALSSWVTLAPGERRFTATYRLDNPTPTRRSDRLWVNVLMHAAAYDADHIIYPVGYISPHGAGWVKPFYAAGGETSWVGVSHFAMYPEHRFAGTYDPKHDVNHLVIRDGGPGMKLYTRKGEGGFMELWFGSGVVFEDPGGFVGPYEPVQFRLTFWAASGIGRVLWADETLAIGHKDGAFQLTAAAEAEVVIEVDGERHMFTLQPGEVRPVDGKADATVALDLDGEDLGAVLPMTFADTTDRHPKVKSLGGKHRLELESISNHVGAPVDWHAIRQAEKLIKHAKVADIRLDPETVLSLANTVYRYGHFALASQLLGRLPDDDPAADYLRGLIAWETEGAAAADFGDAGPEANYHRALQAVANGDKPAAVKLLDEMLAASPRAYRPALLRAVLTEQGVGPLIDKNPASVEALVAAKLLGDEDAAAALAEMIEADDELRGAAKRFEAEATTGAWTHPPRFEPLLPKE